MEKLGLILLVFGFVCFVIAIFRMEVWQKLVAAGLAFVTAASIFAGIPTIFH